MTQISLNSYRDKYYLAIAFWLEIDQSTAESLYPQLPTGTFSQFHQMAVDPNKSTRTTLTLPFNVAGLKQFSIMPDCVGQHWNDASA